MSIILTIILGFVVGLIARALMPGDDQAGFIATTLLGIGGAILGKFLGQAFGLYKDDEPAGFFMSLVGAILLLLLYNYFMRKKTAP